ncbi:hypothetical protein V498_10456, partial [Pseudogymnoascus sp. VKM F-4517 (FW-2822)]
DTWAIIQSVLQNADDPRIPLCQPECDDWDEDGSDWQGFQVVTCLLAENRDYGRGTDLRIEANELGVGLNSRVSEKENSNYLE